MKIWRGAVSLGLAAIVTGLSAQQSPPQRPQQGRVEILRSSELRAGMKGTAWTVFQGTEPEPVPVEIIGLLKNAWGPKQDVIMAKLGGKALETNVASGMSGSPVYIGGRLIGAIALRFSIFSPDAICGITPIELMLEINDLDESKPAGSRAPDKIAAHDPIPVPGEMLARLAPAARWSEGGAPPVLTEIETPLTFSGFDESVLREFSGLFQQMGIRVAQGGAASTSLETKPAAGWAQALRPGDPVAGVLVSGDMSITGLGTVTYNDGKRILAFGHPFFNLGPVNMPMSKGEILMVLKSTFQPVKFANATEIVGTLKQDRHSGILGVLGEQADMIPVSVNVRSLSDTQSVRSEKRFRFNVFVQQRWTPQLMMVTLFNSISGLNEFREEATYRLSGQVELDGQRSLSLSSMFTTGDMPMPASILLAGWWGEKFNRLFTNAVKTPRLKNVNVTVDLLPERRIATIENAWVSASEVRPGDEVALKLFLRPYRGPRIERELKLKIPVGLAKGDHRILLSDADTLNRMQNAAGLMNRYIDLPEAVSLINQERTNNRLYVSLVRQGTTAYYEDKTMPSLPASVLNVMQNGRSSNRPLVTSSETAMPQAEVPFDYVITGSHSLKISVK